MANETQQRSVYIKLVIYDWDASPRTSVLRHYFKGDERPSISSHARHVAIRLRKMVQSKNNLGRACKWLQRNHNIYGFIEGVEGVYVTTTEKVL